MSADGRDVDLSDLFWENTKLNQVTIQAFGRRQREHALAPAEAPNLEFPGPDLPLRPPRGDLDRLLRRRRSRRAFSPRPLGAADLGGLFGALGRGPEGRLFPSAGATYPLEVFALLHRVEGAPGGHAVRYNHDNHSLSVVGPAPPWAECAPLVNLETEGEPAALFLFLLRTARITGKYGDRGTRFALMEVGHAAQNLALALAERGLAGCEAGGVLDEPVKRLLGLRDPRTQVALGYACGHPAAARAGRREGPRYPWNT